MALNVGAPTRKNMHRPMRFTVLMALIPCLGVLQVTAQDPVTRPAISEEVSPVEELSVSVATHVGRTASGVVRRPPGRGPFPAAIVIHGGFGPKPLSALRHDALSNPTMTRFLAAGFVTVVPTFHSAVVPQGVWDMLAIVDHVKQMRDVDRTSVVLYGCSAGGDLVLKIASETEVAATTAEEPVTLGFTGMFTEDTPKAGDSHTLADLSPMWADPHKFYTPAIRRITEERMRKVTGSIFIAQGDQRHLLGGVDHHKIVNEILIPGLKAAGTEVEETTYPGRRHCFGFWGGASGGAFSGSAEAEESASTFFADMATFFKRHLSTQPHAVDDSLVEYVPVSERRR